MRDLRKFVRDPHAVPVSLMLLRNSSGIPEGMRGMQLADDVAVADCPCPGPSCSPRLYRASSADQSAYVLPPIQPCHAQETLVHGVIAPG
jgi:hypothetical protein